MNIGKSAVSLIALALSVGLGAAQAQASTVTLTFGDLPNGTVIGNYFNGQVSGYPPAGAGPNYGLVFSTANEQKDTTSNPPPKPGTGKFENNPSGVNGVAYFPYSSSTPGYLNDAGGFNYLSFDYSLLNNSSTYDTTVKIYSGLGGTGTLLDTITLNASSDPVTCTRSFDEFCTWSFASALLSGQTAESAVFLTQGNTVVSPEFDELTIGTVPEPTSWALMLLGFAGLGVAGYRRSRRKLAAA